MQHIDTNIDRPHDRGENKQTNKHIFQTLFWFVSWAVFYSNSDHFTVGARAYSQYTTLYIMYMGSMWSWALTTISLSLFVNLNLQVKWVIACLLSVKPVNKMYSGYWQKVKGSACKP